MFCVITASVWRVRERDPSRTIRKIHLRAPPPPTPSENSGGEGRRTLPKSAPGTALLSPLICGLTPEGVGPTREGMKKSVLRVGVIAAAGKGTRAYPRT